eukprot:XP_014772636.1 PREDICTED: uncharacterized protein LOC106870916 [Octopus bimaculoides]
MILYQYCKCKQLNLDDGEGRVLKMTQILDALQYPRTEEIIDRVEHILMDDRHLTTNHIANLISIFRERVENILRNELRMRNICARWVPCFLIPDQKRISLIISQKNLTLVEVDPVGFLGHFLTHDECWAHHFVSETRTHSMQWKYSSSPVPKSFTSFHLKRR